MNTFYFLTFSLRSQGQRLRVTQFLVTLVTDRTGKMASDMKLRTIMGYIIEFFREEKNTPSDINRGLLNVYGNQTADVSIVRVHRRRKSIASDECIG